MRKLYTVILVLALISLVPYLPQGHSQTPKEPPSQHKNDEDYYYELVGEAAPEIILKGSDGKDYKLSDYLGRTVVLEWFNSRCPLVNIRYDNNLVQQRQKKYAEQGVVWFTVDSTAEGKLGYLNDMEAEKTRQGINNGEVILLLDREGDLARKMRVDIVPYSVVINAEGNIVYMGAMDEISQGRDERGIFIVEEKVNYIETILDALLSGQAVPMVYNTPTGCSLKR